MLAQAEQQNRELKKQQQQQQQQQQQHQQHQQHQHQQQQQHHAQQQQQQQQQQAFNAAHMSASNQRKSYEAMIADINKVAEYSSKIGSYSHEAKVNKWLAEQTAMSEQMGAEYLSAPRRRRPRVDPSLLDWKKLTGEENVAVINRLTGKKVTGSKAPQLKRLGQWLMENPMFDVDPKWAELVKERGNLPHDLQKRLPGTDRGSNKGKSPGRPPMMPSPTSQQSQNQANLAATSMASGLNFSSLGNLNNSLLSGLSLGNFDPKNNPLLMPFGGLPNLGALGGLGNIGNLSNMSLTNSLFANLAGLGLPSLAGMEAALGGAATSQAETNVVNSVSGKNSSSTSATSTSKSRNKMDSQSKSSAPSTSTSSSMPTNTPFPFFFPNPSLLYTPLGLGGLNPFSMQPGGVSSAYESLAQCGLLNPPNSSGASTSSRKPSSSSSSRAREQREQRDQREQREQRDQRELADSLKRKEAEKKSRYSLDPGLTLQQYTDMALAHGSEDRRRSEPERNEKKETIELSEIADLSARLERKSKEQEMKEALEQLSRTSAELLTRNLEDLQRPLKRGRSSDHHQISEQQQIPSSLEVTLEPVSKRTRVETVESTPKVTVTEANVEVETILRPLPITAKRAPSPQQQPPPQSPAPPPVTVTPPIVAPPPQPSPVPSPTPAPAPVPVPAPPAQEESATLNTSSNSNKEIVESQPVEETTPQASTKADSSNNKTLETEEENKASTKSKKSRSGKRANVEPPPERKNLRSSAGRQARAAAERQARLEGEQHADQHESHGD